MKASPGANERIGQKFARIGVVRPCGPAPYASHAEATRGAALNERDISMRYRRLGHSGLFVSELCLGTMTFGGSDDMWGQIGQLRQEEADSLVRTALDAGINFIDTANVYAAGKSEEILGQSIRNLGVAREDLVIATKVLGPMGEGPNARGASRGHEAGPAADAQASALRTLQKDDPHEGEDDHQVDDNEYGFHISNPRKFSGEF